MNESTAEQQQENLSGLDGSAYFVCAPLHKKADFNEEYYKWSDGYDRETLRAREAMPQPLNVAKNTTGKGI